MRTFFSSESVTEGHPDKVCDQISDALLDALLSSDPSSRAAIETTCCTDFVHVMGEVTTKAAVDYEAIIRKTIADIGYTKDEYLFTDRTKVIVTIHTQSPDIALGVDREGAGDQGMMFGYASDETEEYLPLAFTLAHRLTSSLTEARVSGEIPYLRPDGKSQVTVQYDNGRITRVDTVVLSAQHDEDIDTETLRKDLLEKVIRKIIPSSLLDDETKYYINPTGRFVLGGPAADTGLTGRKIIADTYGGYAHHGGGAFSGKDATKVDRSAAYAARNAAKTIVASGAASRCEIQLAYAIGVKDPVSVHVDTFGTGKIGEDVLTSFIRENWDLSPRGIIREFRLTEPCYGKLSATGHFMNPSSTWEQVSEEKVSRLKALLS
ncbi:MAG: methionine adenosyltransferase [Bullifex sp.]